jgi:hypothetical protein
MPPSSSNFTHSTEAGLLLLVKVQLAWHLLVVLAVLRHVIFIGHTLFSCCC